MQTDAATLANEHPSVIARFLDDLVSKINTPLVEVSDCLSFKAKVALTKIAGI